MKLHILWSFLTSTTFNTFFSHQSSFEIVDAVRTVMWTKQRRIVWKVYFCCAQSKCCLILIFWNAIQRSIYLEHDVRIQRDKNGVRAPLKYWFHWFKFQFRWTIALHSHFAHIVSARSVSILILLFVHFVRHWRNRMKCAVIILKWAITDAIVFFFPPKNMETLSLYRKRVWCKVWDRIWFEFQKKWQKNVMIAWDVSRVDHWYFNNLT